MDQAGFKIEAMNPSFGKTVSWLRCDDKGQYNRDRKVNCMMAMSADHHYNMEWHDTWPQEEGEQQYTGYSYSLDGFLISWQLITLVNGSVLR